MNYKVLIVVSNYYQEISKNLIEGAEMYLRKTSITPRIIKVPGCFEIPYIVKKKDEDYDGFIALGCIIRGETYHFELISNEVTRKIMDLSIVLNKPIGFGILTCDNIDQAQYRSDPVRGNKGKEAAQACVDLLALS